MASGKKYYYLKDYLGSTRSVIDDNQNTVAEQTMYDSYGKLDNITVSSADPPREKFTGKEFDEDGADDENITGGMKLFYFGARYYDPEIGVWISTDPKEQFWGLYTYAGNGYSPINSTDPDGNLIGALTGGIISGISGYVSGGMEGAKNGAAAGFIGGAMVDAVVLTGGGTAAVIVTAGAAGLFSHALENELNGVQTTLKSGVIAAGSGLLGGAVGVGTGKIIDKAVKSSVSVSRTAISRIGSVSDDLPLASKATKKAIDNAHQKAYEDAMRNAATTGAVVDATVATTTAAATPVVNSALDKASFTE